MVQLVSLDVFLIWRPHWCIGYYFSCLVSDIAWIIYPKYIKICVNSDKKQYQMSKSFDAFDTKPLSR